jgi:hypothetical protein
MAARHVHKSNFLNNFATIGFNLCYVLKVCGCPFMAEGFTNALIGELASSKGQTISEGGAAEEWHYDGKRSFTIPRKSANTFECGSGSIPIISLK